MQFLCYYDIIVCKLWKLYFIYITTLVLQFLNISVHSLKYFNFFFFYYIISILLITF